jgi:hypothetical protein
MIYCSETFFVDEPVLVIPRAFANTVPSALSVPVSLCFLDNDTNELLEMVFGLLPPTNFRINQHGYTVLGYLPASSAARSGDWTLQLVAARNCIHHLPAPPIAELLDKSFTGIHNVAILRPVICRLLLSCSLFLFFPGSLLFLPSLQSALQESPNVQCWTLFFDCDSPGAFVKIVIRDESSQVNAKKKIVYFTFFFVSIQIVDSGTAVPARG